MARSAISVLLVSVLLVSELLVLSLQPTARQSQLRRRRAVTDDNSPFSRKSVARSARGAKKPREAEGAQAASDDALLESLLGELDSFDEKTLTADSDDQETLDALLEEDDDEEEDEDAEVVASTDVVEDDEDEEDDVEEEEGEAEVGEVTAAVVVDATEDSTVAPAAGNKSSGEDEDEDDEEEDKETDAVTSDSLTELLKMGQVEDDELMDEEEWLLAKDEYDETEARRASLREKRRLQNEEEARLAAERGIGLLERDPLCRAIVVCITTGSESDNSTVAELRDLLRNEFGKRVELAHNCDPDPEEDMPLFEVWLEGYRYMVLHARNANGDGNLLTDKMHSIVDIVREEVSDEAQEVLGTYVGFEGDD